MEKMRVTIGKKQCSRCHSATVSIVVEWKQYKDGRIEDGRKFTTECPICHSSETGKISFAEACEAAQGIEWQRKRESLPEARQGPVRDPSMSEKERLENLN